MSPLRGSTDPIQYAEQPPTPHRATRSRRDARTSRAVYWLLVCMGLGVLAPTLWLPEWRRYQGMIALEQVAEQRTDELTAWVAGERKRLEALTTDPAVVVRIAEREFGARPPGERWVQVFHEPPPLARQASLFRRPDPSPAPATRSSWPDLLLDTIFCDPRLRPVLIGLSTAVLAIALALFSFPRPRGRGVPTG